MKEKITQHSQGRMLILLSVVTLVSIITMVIAFNSYSVDTISDLSTDVIDYQAIHSAYIVSNELQDLTTFGYSMVTNLDLVSSARTLARNPDAYEARYRLGKQLQENISANFNIETLGYINGTDGTCIQLQKDKSYTPRSPWQDADYCLSLSEQILNNDAPFFMMPSEEEYEDYRGVVFYIGLPVRTYGSLLLGIRHEFFNPITDIDMLPSTFQDSMSYIADENGKLVYCSSASYQGKSLEAFLSGESIDETTSVIASHVIGPAGWTYYFASPRHTVYLLLARANRLEFILILMLSVVFILAIYLVTRHLTRQVTLTADNIRISCDRIRSNVPVPLSTSVELNRIIDRVNSMISQINTLLTSLDEERLAGEKALDMQRKAELQALEMQINPHFLYNTLDTINWMALEREEYEISSLLGAMSDLLRYSLANIDAAVSVRDEIEWLKNYLFLQEKRFVNRFSWEIRVDPALNDCLIRKMLLQPLAENCILHAFEDRRDGLLLISVQKHDGDGNRMRITVADNGCGIDPSVLEELRRQILSDAQYSSVNIGIFNVSRRLRAYYGNDAVFTINSDENGTEAVIELPVSFDDESLHEDVTI